MEVMEPFARGLTCIWYSHFDKKKLSYVFYQVLFNNKQNTVVSIIYLNTMKNKIFYEKDVYLYMES